MDEIVKIFESENAADISMYALIFNLIVGYFLSQLIAIHFKKFGSTLSSRAEFSQVLPFILMTTLLVITIVKSSLALSLGLVGALSIVRFRTPIKEPEELAYLFLAIACGLGLGANQVLETVLSVVFILGAVVIYKYGENKNEIKGKNIYLTIRINKKDVPLKSIIDLLNKYVDNINLRRSSSTSEYLNATFMIEFKKINDLDEAILDIRKLYEDSEITFVDQSQLPGI
jgi:hypothetical protein